MRSNLDVFTRYDERIIQVRIPVPLALKTVNSYLIKDEEGYVWVDPGLNTKHIQDFWNQVFKATMISPKQVTKIICTHFHPDHFGLTGYAQHLTDAPVYLSNVGYANTQYLWGTDDELFAEKLSRLFTQHQVPQQLVNEIVENLNWFKTLVYPFPTVTPLEANTTLQIESDHWRIIETSGHAKGHMMLYNEHSKDIICGDQVLPHITPHVGVVPGYEEERPLQQFLDSLSQIKQLDISMAYPGHGEPFAHWNNRIEEIINHHQRRLLKLQQCIIDKVKLSAFDASNLIFGTHLHKQPQNLRFAITEMIAHLDYLVEQGNVTKEESDTGAYYYAMKY